MDKYENVGKDLTEKVPDSGWKLTFWGFIGLSNSTPDVVQKMGFINVLEPGEWPHYKSDTIQIPSEHGPTALRPKEKSPRQQGNRLGACSLEGHKCGSALELGSAGTSPGCQIFYVPLHEVTTLVSPFISPKTKIQKSTTTVDLRHVCHVQIEVQSWH